MRALLYIFMIATFVKCSTVQRNTITCGNDQRNFQKKGQDSRIIEFKRTAIMDTVTCIIHGNVIDLESKEPLIYGMIVLSNSIHTYSVNADTTGQFNFNHISSGKYSLTVNYIGYRKLSNDTIRLGSGDISELKIGMGKIGQDDLKK